MTNKYSVIVNTCDTYDDCWHPFFKLFKKFWPNCSAKVYLNTEHKDYQYQGLNIIATKVCEPSNDARRLTWSECLIKALNKIDSDVVLYLQDDYFIKAEVKNELVESYVALMNQDNSIDCIHLTDQGPDIEASESKYEGLFPVRVKQRFRVSCQAALWRKDVLLSYLESHESAWQFEEYASKRSQYMGHNFYAVDTNVVKLNEFEIIPYVFTGIFQGRWMEEVQPLFKENNITIDYSKRGFFLDAPRRQVSTKIADFWQRLPVIIKSRLGLFVMKIKYRS